MMFIVLVGLPMYILDVFELSIVLYFLSDTVLFDSCVVYLLFLELQEANLILVVLKGISDFEDLWFVLLKLNSQYFIFLFCFDVVPIVIEDQLRLIQAVGYERYLMLEVTFKTDRFSAAGMAGYDSILDIILNLHIVFALSYDLPFLVGDLSLVTFELFLSNFDLESTYFINRALDEVLVFLV
jgi:hypothetical protein